jgi:hypothetical protein
MSKFNLKISCGLAQDDLYFILRFVVRPVAVKIAVRSPASFSNDSMFLA